MNVQEVVEDLYEAAKNPYFNKYDSLMAMYKIYSKSVLEARHEELKKAVQKIQSLSIINVNGSRIVNTESVITAILKEVQ